MAEFKSEPTPAIELETVETVTPAVELVETVEIDCRDSSPGRAEVEVDRATRGSATSYRVRLATVPRSARVGLRGINSSFNLPEEYLVQFKPDGEDPAGEGKRQKSDLESRIGRVGSSGRRASDDIENRFTDAFRRRMDSSKSRSGKDRKSESLIGATSPERRKKGKRLCQYDFDSEINNDEAGRKKTYKDRIKTISAKLIRTIKIVGGFDESGEEGSSTDSSSSAKTSVIITEVTELSDENQTSIDTNSQSGKDVTARKLSSGNSTLSNAEFDNGKQQLECLEENEICNESQDAPRHIEPDLERKPSVLIKVTGDECKPISEEYSEIQTSEDNLSPLEDDDDNSAATPVKTTISPGDIIFRENDTDSRECGEGSVTSSEEALLSSEENQLAPESAVIHKNKIHEETKVDKLSKTAGRRKYGLTSSEESITPLTTAKSESETDTKDSWIGFRSESTSGSKKGLTSSEEWLSSVKSDSSKKKDDELKSSEDRSSSEMIGSEAIVISTRDRIQQLISDRKTEMSKILLPAAGEMVPAHVEKMNKPGLSKELPLQIDESESEESITSGYTDSSSTIEIERISERLLPIGGTLTLIKGKPPSERSATPGRGSITSLIDSLTWNKRANELTDNQETTIQINKDKPQESTTRVTKFDEIKSLPEETPSSNSDLSSDETQQNIKVLCEQVIKETASTNKDIFRTAHYCINSITFGIRRSLSEERLYSIEADTQAHREKNTSNTKQPSAKNSKPTNACDACTFLLLLRTLTIREKVIHYAFRKMDVCIIHSVGVSHWTAQIFPNFLKRMPLCEFCMFPSVEKMMLELVQSKHGVLMHRADNLPPIYVIFPPYAENNKTIGRVVHLNKKKISDYTEKFRIRVMMADRYIFFPKLHDSSIWRTHTEHKRHDTPKIIASNVKPKNVLAKMDDIPELNESIVEEPRPTASVETEALNATPAKKRPSKRKVRKCVLKKWRVKMTGSNSQGNRRNGSTPDELISPNFIAGSDSASTNVTRGELIALNNKRRRCILKKWCVKYSPKQKRKMTHKFEEQSFPTEESSNISEPKVADKTTETETKPTSAAFNDSDTSQFLIRNKIDGVVLVRKKRPWWKCPKKKPQPQKKPAVNPKPIMPDFYKKFLHPTYQQPLLSYTIESRTTGQTETRVLTRQDLMAQRLAYHYIRKLTSRTDLTPQRDKIETIKPSLTDFQSRRYEERRTLIRSSRQSVPKPNDKVILEKLSTSEREPESPLDLRKIDLSQIDYHFEDCPIIQKGDTPFKKFLKIQQVYKTTDFKDSWVEYHVENCSYFMIDGTTVTDLKFVYLVLAEKKDDICDCAEKLIKGGNIYHRHKSSKTFHHDLCLLFPKQLESGEIDIQGLFNPYIPSREFDEDDVIRFYFISKRLETKESRLIDYCDVPISKFGKVQQKIKTAFSILRNEIETTTNPIESNVKHDINARSYKEGPRRDTVDTSIHRHRFVELAEYKRLLSPPRVDSESEDSTTVYSLEDCLIHANEHLTDDSTSPPPDSPEFDDNQGIIIQQSGECSTKIGNVRKYLPSPRPVEEARDDKSLDHQGIRDILSLRQDRDDKKHIYYNLGEFTTKIRKDQRVALSKPLDINDDNASAANVCQPGPSCQKLLSPSTSLRMMSSNQTDREVTQLHGPLTYQRSMSLVGEGKEDHIWRETQSQEHTGGQLVMPASLIEDSHRQGCSLDFIEKRRIRSQENITKVCTCNWFESIKTYSDAVHYLESNLKDTLCAYHGAMYVEELAKKHRNLSQGDLSQKKSLSLVGPPVYTSDQKIVSPRSIASSHRQSSYPPFQRTSTSPSRCRDVINDRTNVYPQNYSLNTVVSPTRVQGGIRQSVYSADTPFQQSRITNQRTRSRSQGDLTRKRTLQCPEYIGKHHADQLCMNIHEIGRGDEQFSSKENINKVDRARQIHSTPQKTLRDQRVLSDLEDRFVQELHSEYLARATNRGAISRRKSAEDKFPHSWQSWRDGPAPF